MPPAEITNDLTIGASHAAILDPIGWGMLALAVAVAFCAAIVCNAWCEVWKTRKKIHEYYADTLYNILTSEEDDKDAP